MGNEDVKVTGTAEMSEEEFEVKSAKITDSLNDEKVHYEKPEVIDVDEDLAPQFDGDISDDNNASKITAESEPNPIHPKDDVDDRVTSDTCADSANAMKNVDIIDEPESDVTIMEDENCPEVHFDGDMSMSIDDDGKLCMDLNGGFSVPGKSAPVEDDEPVKNVEKIDMSSKVKQLRYKPSRFVIDKFLSNGVNLTSPIIDYIAMRIVLNVNISRFDYVMINNFKKLIDQVLPSARISKFDSKKTVDYDNLSIEIPYNTGGNIDKTNEAILKIEKIYRSLVDNYAVAKGQSIDQYPKINGCVEALIKPKPIEDLVKLTNGVHTMGLIISTDKPWWRFKAGVLTDRYISDRSNIKNIYDGKKSVEFVIRFNNSATINTFIIQDYIQKTEKDFVPIFDNYTFRLTNVNDDHLFKHDADGHLTVGKICLSNSKDNKHHSTTNFVDSFYKRIVRINRTNKGLCKSYDIFFRDIKHLTEYRKK